MKSEAKKSNVMYGQDMGSISIGKIQLSLNIDEVQTSTKGRPFRISGSRMNLQHPAKWIDKMEMHHFIHTFKYLDEQGGFFEVEVDYQNKYINNSLKKL